MKDFKNIFLTMLTPILWGTTYLITTLFLPINRPFFIALMRALPSGLLLMLIYRQFPKKTWIIKSFILGTLNIGGFFAFLFFASYRLSGGIVAMLGSIQTLLVVLFSWFILKEKPTFKILFACILVIFGVVLLVVKPNASLNSVGIISALLGAISMSLGIVLTKKWGRPVSNIVFTSWQLVFGSIILIPLTLIFEGLPPQLNLNNYIGLLWLGLLNTVVGYYLWFRGIEKLKVSQITFLGALSPITALILGYIFLKQGLNMLQFFGIFIIFISILVSQLNQTTLTSIYNLFSKLYNTISTNSPKKKSNYLN